MDSKPLTYYEIDLNAIAHNLRQVRAHVGENVLIAAVVKANAYGHGAIEVGRAALQAGANWLAVNRVNEGVELRQAGIAGPILVMGYALPSEAHMIFENHLIPTITELETAQVLSNLATEPFKIHVKVDTGMGRLGVLPSEALSFIQALQALPNLEIEGLYTHFSVADSAKLADQDYTRQQIETLNRVLATLAKAGIEIPLPHAANTAGMMYYPEAHFKMVRVGIGLYGLKPDASHEPPFELKPALSLKSHVGRVRTLPPNSSISYGRTYVTEKARQVALVPVGYGDGYDRLLSNRGAVLIRGQRAPIQGRVCMDQFVVDVSDISDVQVGDEIVLLGCQDEAEITADEIAQWAETINYEVTTSLLQRAPRLYIPLES